MDMQTMISVYGAPEYQTGPRVMSANMGRYYGLPIWGNAGMSDSCALDEQAAIDATFSVMVALLDRHAPGARCRLPGGRADHLA